MKLRCSLPALKRLEENDNPSDTYVYQVHFTATTNPVHTVPVVVAECRLDVRRTPCLSRHHSITLAEL